MLFYLIIKNKMWLFSYFHMTKKFKKVINNYTINIIYIMSYYFLKKFIINIYAVNI